jgi:hypothetical protein
MERLILEALRVLLRAELEREHSDEVREALLAQVGAIRGAVAVWSAMEPSDGNNILDSVPGRQV